MFYHLNLVIPVTFWLGAYYEILEPGLQNVNPALAARTHAMIRNTQYFGLCNNVF